MGHPLKEANAPHSRIYRNGKCIVTFYESGWIYANLQGLKYRCEICQKAFRKKNICARLTLHREKDNKYDKNAIRVEEPPGPKTRWWFGYLPRELAKILAPRMDKGEEFICEKVQDLNGPRVRIKPIKSSPASKKPVKKDRAISKRMEDLVL